MAKLIIAQQSLDVSDNTSISAPCDTAGIPFDCNTGVCGSCQIKIIEGSKNLNALTEEEIELGLDENNRLACKCIIHQGTVVIDY